MIYKNFHGDISTCTENPFLFFVSACVRIFAVFFQTTDHSLRISKIGFLLKN